ncbi:hypothetical protein ACQKM2_16065 [Streptomyces sp. NPDC004126]|uniref:hypothetical protein n=1 Tax=Streptomyces sp. NPDC004126 TaxID=3390695 RepID=UPI003D07ECBC
MAVALCSVLVTPAGAQSGPSPVPGALSRADAVPAPGEGTAATPAGRMARSLERLAARSYADTFSGVQVDAEHSTVTLYLTRPERATALVAEARREAPAGERAGVRVVVKAAKYSRGQLEAAMDRIKGSAESWRRSGEVAIDEFGPLDGGAGLRITADRPAVAAALVGRLLDERRNPDETHWYAPAAADIRFEEAHPAPDRDDPRRTAGGRAAAPSAAPSAAREAVPSRWNDNAPHFGGAILSKTRHEFWCTSGFAMDVPGWGRYMVTSGRCGSPGTYLYSGFNDVGQIVNELPDIDTAIIDTAPTGGSAGRLWRLDDQKSYVGWVTSQPGDQVCQTGVRTGYRCEMYVGQPQRKWVNGAYVTLTPACTRDGSAAYAADDEGGPVFSWASAYGVNSHGMISSGMGTWDSSGTAATCVGYVPTGTILGAWGARMTDPYPGSSASASASESGTRQPRT